MTASEMETFERLIQGDERLRREVEQWRAAMEAGRDWIAQEAPGTERLKELKIPSLGVHSSKHRAGANLMAGIARRLDYYALRGAAAIAIFVLGFMFGNVTQWQLWKSEPSERTIAQSIAGGPVEAAATIIPREASQSAVKEKKRVPLPQYSGEENGQIIIETLLSGSSSRALWVVDGSFELAQSSKGEER
jgi:hypothetical protein